MQPIEHRLIDDGEDGDRVDVPITNFECSNVVEQNHSKSSNVVNNGTGNADDIELPKFEREPFSQYILSSFNQMSDIKALQAMMDIQGLIEKCQNEPAPKIE